MAHILQHPASTSIHVLGTSSTIRPTPLVILHHEHLMQQVVALSSRIKLDGLGLFPLACPVRSCSSQKREQDASCPSFLMLYSCVILTTPPFIVMSATITPLIASVLPQKLSTLEGTNSSSPPTSYQDTPSGSSEGRPGLLIPEEGFLRVGIFERYVACEESTLKYYVWATQRSSK